MNDVPPLTPGRYARQEIPLLPGDRFLLVWEGDADMTRAGAFQGPLLEAAWGAQRADAPLTLDLRACPFIDTMCLRALALAVRALASHRDGAKALTVLTLPERAGGSNAARVLRIMGMGRVLTHVEKAPDATDPADTDPADTDPADTGTDTRTDATPPDGA